MNIIQPIAGRATSGLPQKQKIRTNPVRGLSGQGTRASYERYLMLAEVQQRAGNRIEAENYYQHAEHYFRLMKGGTP
ncbi:DUF4167 domain-containing protein [Labrys miyagiensis]|uniref:DUF4167 domain-containing protein n=1 Tax=Labrys miyagiensis TaxID=346912 RepID=UPI0032AF9382